MTTVKLNQPLLIENINHPEGAVVLVTAQRARELVALGHACHCDGKVANPDTNPLADAIHPYPPGGVIVNPADALAPNVADNPGLKALAAATAKSGAAKVIPGKVTPDGKHDAADITADEIVLADEGGVKIEDVAKAAPKPPAPTATPKPVQPTPTPSPKPVEAPKAADPVKVADAPKAE